LTFLSVKSWWISDVVGLCFFFSSRRRHTRFSRDWSSDVCSSDLCHSAQCFPVRTGVEIFDRQPIEFVEDVFPQIVNGLLRHFRHRKLLQKLKQTARDVMRAEQQQQLRHFSKIDPGSRFTCDRFISAFEQYRNHHAHHFRAEHAENRAENRCAKNENDRNHPRFQIVQQPKQRPFKMFRFVQTDEHPAVAAHACAQRFPRLFLFSTHPVSTSPIWEAAISRYTSHVSINCSCVPFPTIFPLSKTM